MADTATLERSLDINTAFGKPDTRLTREVEAVLEAAEWAHSEPKPITKPWSFRMPLAGVKYYSF